MTSTKIYQDIAARTGGNIYIGVVGPVRTGKSTFIRKVMEHLVLNEINDPFLKERTIDELPQASAGKTIMTTEPKFVPENAIQINLKDNAKCNIRMVDCVGFVVDGAIGQYEDDAPRMVRTPWSDDEISFEQAAEIGTQKVIREHSTITVVVTTDGSFGDLQREEYIDAERRVINEMKKTGKPFIILLNSMFPSGEQTKMIQQSIEDEYQTPVIIKNCNELVADDINEILSLILAEFPIAKINVDMPTWIMHLENNNPIKQEVYDWIRTCACKYKTMSQINAMCTDLEKNQYIEMADSSNKQLGDGGAEIHIDLPKSLYFSMLSKILGREIKDDGDLMLEIEHLQHYSNEYEKIRTAFEIAKQNGYGIVKPNRNDLTMELPTEYRQGNRFGVRIKATAPTYHIIRADICSEISPIVGDEEQSKTLLGFMGEHYHENMDEIWNYNIFGKTVYDMVDEGFEGKFGRLPDDARCKLQETLSKILNEGSGGLICIIL